MKVKPEAPVKHEKISLFPRFEEFAAKREKTIFYALVAAAVLLSLISFNARISEAHDDALYLEGGWRYVKEFPGYFYTQNAPLYVLFLAFLIKTIGFRLIIFKLFSVAFSVTGFILFYKAFRKRVPFIILLPVAVFHAVNHLIMYYASMTFTEAFYFFLQGLLFYCAVRLMDVVQSPGFDLSATWKRWLALGLSMFLISTAKSSAIVVIPAMMLFFALERNWKAAGASLVVYLVFKLPYQLIVRLVWGTQNQFAGQGKILMQKDPYDKSLGDEDVTGFVARFFENANLALGKRFYQLLGWRSEENTDSYWVLAVLTIAIALYGFWKFFLHRNRPMVMAALFTGAQTVLSWVILQTRWDQPRITLVCMPVILLLMIYALYEWSAKSGAVRNILVVVLIALTGSVCISSVKRGFSNIPIVSKNLRGDKYYGYTPDWRNFLRCSEWCADSLPENALVASRKAPMSFVYGRGKKFFPIYSVIKKDTATNQSDPDSALAFFKKNGVTHVIMAHLRMNPADPQYGYINTIHNILYPIAVKYPWRLKMVHAEAVGGILLPPEAYTDPSLVIGGGGQLEEAYVYQFVYP
jgi:hypothetical protein